MIDQALVYVKGGDGGDGAVSFRHEKFVPYGGPDGGDGGHGGSVYLVGDTGDTTLREFQHRSRLVAGDGGRGKGKKMHGKKGEDLEVKVPLGTVVWSVAADGSKAKVADITENGQRVLAAKGGRGGWGNARFATSTDQAPRIATKGTLGREDSLLLDLKLLADVGLVGYPNAGKSTLLRAVSRARPKVGDYPFTTLEPVLGVVYVGLNAFVLADLPGLIEGAHDGRGLGLEFLRHIERTRVLIHILDGTSGDPLDDYHKVEAELVMYKGELGNKPRIAAVNKIDVPEVRARMPEIEQQLKGLDIPVHFISAATGEGAEDLMKATLEMVSRSKPPEKLEEAAEFKVFRPHPLTPKKARSDEDGS